jgi:transcriptional regulator with XRE-family HTH domain
MRGGPLTNQDEPSASSEESYDDNLEATDGEEQVRIGARLKEAREYVGLLQEDVASALGIPRASVSALESGKRRVTGLEIRRLARLYRKSVGWLLGEEDIEIEETEPLFRATESLSQRDKEQVLRFAEFLAAAGKPAGARKASMRPPRAVGESVNGGDETAT